MPLGPVKGCFAHCRCYVSRSIFAWDGRDEEECRRLCKADRACSMTDGSEWKCEVTNVQSSSEPLW